MDQKFREISPHLGIMVDYRPSSQPPFLEKGFYRIISLQGQQQNIPVTVFAPPFIDWNTQTVEGYRYKNKQWYRGRFRLPTLIYDRIFYSGLRQYKYYKSYIQRLQKEPYVILLGRSLPGKWKVYQMLGTEKALRPYLPRTWKYDPRTLIARLKQEKKLCIKPSSGSQGKGVMKVSLEQNMLIINGRDRRNRPFSRKYHQPPEGLAWLRANCRNRPYIIQPYLSLHTVEGIPFDIRILMQKNELGRWQETGRAVRRGIKGGLTSNLHGGGLATSTNHFLQQQFTPVEVDAIQMQLADIVRYTPAVLEKQHGPLFELGLDVGIDRQAKVWILEVNSKPGRRSLKQSENSKAFIRSMTAPLQYAQFRARQWKGACTWKH